jgi:hypothetical protein
MQGTPSLWLAAMIRWPCSSEMVECSMSMNMKSKPARAKVSVIEGWA